MLTSSHLFRFTVGAIIMCGIVGLYLKNKALYPKLGQLFKPMLVEMTSRGPDSAGVAIYRDPVAAGELKFSLAHDDSEHDWTSLAASLGKALGASASITQRDTHALLITNADEAAVVSWLAENAAGVRLVGSGQSVEIYKETGLPEDVYARFGLESAAGRKRQGVSFGSENDSEVAAAYLTWKLRNGISLKQALEDALDDLDGFFTFCVGTSDGFAVVRDPIACKHAVLAETDDWVAMATEFRAIATLPGSDQAEIWEPKPATVYSWGSGDMNIDTPVAQATGSAA